MVKSKNEELTREKDIYSLKLETLSKICERKGINIQEEFKILKQEQQKTRSNSDAEGESEQDDNEDDIDLADIGSLSIINEYRVKTENLNKELKEKDTKT